MEFILASLGAEYIGNYRDWHKCRLEGKMVIVLEGKKHFYLYSTNFILIGAVELYTYISIQKERIKDLYEQHEKSLPSINF